MKLDENKKRIVKRVLLDLAQGVSAEEAKKRIENSVGSISSSEIFEIEQSLLSDGVPAEEIKRFCNVHALLFDSTLERNFADPENENHPVNLFKRENREIEKLSAAAAEMAAAGNFPRLKELMAELSKTSLHYARKEQLLFPYLEKQGFYGPSKVMWSKDNDIRDMFKKALAALDKPGPDIVDKFVAPLLEEVKGMIFKEESILFPTSLEKLKPGDWTAIFRESADVGYVFIKPPEGLAEAMDINKYAPAPAPTVAGAIGLPSGSFTPVELAALFNALPFDITFVDKNDEVKYFSEGKGRIFLRTRAVIGRQVRYCHPPQSLKAVEQILTDFREGKRDSYEFWINMKGRLIHIRYFAVRAAAGTYLGALEVTQDITDIRTIQGEKRLTNG